MNLLGQNCRDLVSLIHQVEADAALQARVFTGRSRAASGTTCLRRLLRRLSRR
jgi:hypothetical protein